MKKFLFIILIGAFLLVGCGKNKPISEYPKEVKIEVTSNPSGKSFTGGYGNKKNHVSVGPDLTPQTYITQLEDEWDIVICTFAKDEPGTWELTVKIYVDGELKKQASNSAESGIIAFTITGND